MSFAACRAPLHRCRDPNFWCRRPLTAAMVQYAVQVRIRVTCHAARVLGPLDSEHGAVRLKTWAVVPPRTATLSGPYLQAACGNAPVLCCDTVALVVTLVALPRQP